MGLKNHSLKRLCKGLKEMYGVLDKKQIMFYTIQYLLYVSRYGPGQS